MNAMSVYWFVVVAVVFHGCFVVLLFYCVDVLLYVLLVLLLCYVML